MKKLSIILWVVCVLSFIRLMSMTPIDLVFGVKSYYIEVYTLLVVLFTSFWTAFIATINHIRD